MKSFTAVAIATLALASHASAQILSFSQPVSATMWTAGSKSTVSWTNTCSDITGNTTFPIYLNEQVGAYQVQVSNTSAIGTLDCSKAGSTTVNVPMVPQGSAYSILVTDGGNQSYSAQFVINSSIPAVSTTAATTTIATTTAAATTTATSTAPSTVTTSANATTTASSKPTGTSNAGALKAGSSVALVIVAAVASLML
ncbi:hypothetical protein BGX21_005796 [Mortierella sp. AD011]|nr:hypothetical protein BGX20_005739 [Mortierella sp. AD010]KAF9399688.1 hypothetical protein BGX21_005796 [Mortierella sp. AD011]